MKHLQNILAILIISSSAGVSRGRELGTKCKEEADWINRLLLERVEEETFSVEPVLGVAVPSTPRLDTTIEQLVQSIKESNDTLTAWRIRECLGRYLKAVRPWRPDKTQGIGGSSQLGYDKPHYLGPIEPFPMPVPDDEDYKPGPEGYTTYLNPYNFAEKVEEYKPRPKPASDEYDSYLDSSEETEAVTSSTTTPPPPQPPHQDAASHTTPTSPPTRSTRRPHRDDEYDDYSYENDSDYY